MPGFKLFNNGNSHVLPLQNKGSSSSSSSSARNAENEASAGDEVVHEKYSVEIVSQLQGSDKKLKDEEVLAHKRKFSKIMAVLYNSATGFLIKLPSEVFQKTSSSLMLSQHSFNPSNVHDPENNSPAANLRSHKSKLQLRELSFERNSKLDSSSNNNNLNTDGNVNRAKGKGVVSNISGKYIASAVKALFWSFNSNKDLDGGKRTNYVNSSPYQSELYRKEVVFERDGSISDAIAHCRLSFDGRNKT